MLRNKIIQKLNLSNSTVTLFILSKGVKDVFLGGLLFRRGVYPDYTTLLQAFVLWFGGAMEAPGVPRNGCPFVLWLGAAQGNDFPLL